MSSIKSQRPVWLDHAPVPSKKGPESTSGSWRIQYRDIPPAFERPGLRRQQLQPLEVRPSSTASSRLDVRPSSTASSRKSSSKFCEDSPQAWRNQTLPSGREHPYSPSSESYSSLPEVISPSERLDPSKESVDKMPLGKLRSGSNPRLSPINQVEQKSRVRHLSASTETRNERSKRNLRSIPSGHFRIGAHAALEIDRRFQRDLQEKWQQQHEALTVSRASPSPTAQLFTFPQESQGEGVNLKQGNACCWRSVDFLKTEVLRAPPQLKRGERMEFNGKQSSALHSALEMLAEVSQPLPFVTPKRLSRPAFCRFLLDSGLVNCEVFGSHGAIQYHQAVRCFDVMTQSTYRLDGVPPSASVDEVITLTSDLLGQVAKPAALLEEFFEYGLPRAQRIAEVIFEKVQQRGRDKAIEQQSKQVDVVDLKKHAHIPKNFQASMSEWKNGLNLWNDEFGRHTTTEAIKRRCEQEAAQESYLVDMLVEPGVLYLAEVCRSLFATLFDAYADEFHKKWDDAGNSITIRHLSYAAFFRFCVDFGIFPTVCPFELAKEVYRDAGCLEELGTPPKKPAPIESGEALAKLKQALRNTRASVAVLNAWEPAPGSSKKISRRHSCPILHVRRESKSMPEEPEPEVETQIDLSWVSQESHSLSAQRQNLKSLLSAMGDCCADHFQRMAKLFVSDPDDDVEPPRDDKQSAPADRATADASMVVDTLDKLHISHPWETAEIQELLCLLAPDSHGKVKLSDIDKAINAVQEDAQKRIRAGVTDGVDDSVDVKGSTHGGSAGYVYTPSGKLALGEEARRLDNDAGLLKNNREDTGGLAFGLAAFMESVLQIGLRHLHSNGSIAQAALPGGPKALWMVLYLERRFNQMLRAKKEESTITPTRTISAAWVEESTKYTACSDSTTGPNSSDGETCDSEQLPAGAAYTPKLTRLLREHPGLFTNLPWSQHSLEVHSEVDSIAGAGLATGTKCTTCGRFRNRVGVGSMHCHSCSGIDSMCLRESAFWPLLMRWRLREQCEITPRLPEDEDMSEQAKEDDNFDSRSQASSSVLEDAGEISSQHQESSSRVGSKRLSSLTQHARNLKRQSMPDLSLIRGSRRSSMPTLSTMSTENLAV